MSAIIEYRCECCNNKYDTEEEAAACWQSPVGRFKAGDVVKVDYGRVKFLKHDPDHSGASIHNQQDFNRARNNSASGKNESWWYTNKHFCPSRITKYPIEDAEKLVAEMKLRLAAAERFLKKVKATHEDHPEAPQGEVRESIVSHVKEMKLA
jgi:hypothetical protein